VALAEHARTLPLSQEARIALSVGEASSHHLLGQPDEGLARLPTHLVDPRLDVSKAGLHAALGDLAAAITLLDPAIEQLRGTGLARALKVRAGVLRRLGRIDAGEADLRRARATLVGQHPALLAAILRTEGLFCFHRGRFDACIRLQTEAIEIDPQDGDTAWATQYIGRALMRLARLDEAAEVLEGSCEMLRRQGDRLGERVSLAGLAQLSYRRGDSDGALRWLRRSRQLGITSARDAPATALSFAMVHIDRWEGALALEFAQSARREFGALGEATSAAYAIEAAGLAHLVLGDRDQARKALDRAAEQLTACGLEAEATRPGAWLHFLDGTLPPEPTPSHLESDEVRCLEILRAATSGTPLPSEGLGALSRLARRLIEGPP
jgi:tetratricopeptide (TPR) repeat protein